MEVEMTNIDNINKVDGAPCTVENQVSVDVVKPKRVLHFSDGVLEEFSDDHEGDGSIDGVDANENKIDETNLTWGPWLMHKTSKAGGTILAGCDYVGGALASFLGITTPKYQCEIDEFKRVKEENEKLEKEKQDAASWQESRKLNCNEAITKEMDKVDDRF